MQPTEQQVQRSLEALATGAPTLIEVALDGAGTARHDLPAGLAECLETLPPVRPDRLEEARRRLEDGDQPTDDDLARRMVGRIVCDRLR